MLLGILNMGLYLLFILIARYLFKRFKQLSFIEKAKDKRITKKMIVLLIVISLFFMIFDTLNAIAVVSFMLIFLKIFDFIFYLAKKISKKEVNGNLSFIFTIFVVISLLSYGYFLAHHIVETDYTIYSKKDIGVNNLRIVQISDSHLGVTLNGKDFAYYMKEINKLKPDIVVVTGDFVDDSTKLKDMIKATEALGKIKTKYGIYFIYGNHDKTYFKYRNFSDKQLRKALKKNNIIILEDDIVDITDDIYLVGRKDSGVARKDAETLTEKLDKNKYIICLDHKPDDYGNEVNAGCDLVLSGHTHGGQFWPMGPLSLFLGINDSYYGKKMIDDTIFIVNSGISDWKLKFKLGAISEYVVIDIKNK